DSMIRRHYFSIAVVIGLLEIIDGYLHFSSIETSFRYSFSIIEVCWFVLCVPVFILFKKDARFKLISGSFIIYYLFNAVTAIWIISMGSNVSDFLLPRWWGYFVSVFGAFYLILSVKQITRDSK
ncbi:MAG: hypothetical protein OEZ47_05940, partial [Gammaproteobacteria bacterium]|nr:hypothetical protein [Gammaproteobacteria bacterium]